MTILDYLVLGGFATAFLYTSYRLFVVWLRTPSYEIESETSNIPNRSTFSHRRERAMAVETATQTTDIPGQFR